MLQILKVTVSIFFLHLSAAGPINKTTDKPRILIVSFNTIGGHASLVEGLKKGLKKHAKVDVLDCEKFSRIKGPDYYVLLKKSMFIVSVMQMFHHKFHSVLDKIPEDGLDLFYKVKEFKRHLKKHKYDLVIFTSPIHWNVVNKICFEHKIPCINVVVDYGQPENAKLFWVRDEAMMYFVPRGHYFAKLSEYKSVLTLSGIPIRDKFDQVRNISKSEMKKRLNLEPEKLCVLIFFGGAGSDDMYEIAKGAQNDKDTHYVFICASHDEIKEKIEGLRSDNFTVLGYIPNPAFYIRAADVMVCKPGATSVTESIECETPCIFRSNGEFSVSPIEKWTMKFAVEQGYGTVIDDYSKLQSAIEFVTTKQTNFSKNNGLRECVTIVRRMLKEKDKWRRRFYD